MVGARPAKVGRRCIAEPDVPPRPSHRPIGAPIPPPPCLRVRPVVWPDWLHAPLARLSAGLSGRRATRFLGLDRRRQGRPGAAGRSLGCARLGFIVCWASGAGCASTRSWNCCRIEASAPRAKLSGRGPPTSPTHLAVTALFLRTPSLKEYLHYSFSASHAGGRVSKPGKPTSLPASRTHSLSHARKLGKLRTKFDRTPANWGVKSGPLV